MRTLFLLSLILLSVSMNAQKGISYQQKVKINRLNYQVEQQLKKVLNARDRAALSQMQREAKSISRIRNLRQQKAAIANFNRKYAGLRTQLKSKAKINEQQYISQIQGILPQYRFQRKGSGLVALQGRLLSNYTNPKSKGKPVFIRGKQNYSPVNNGNRTPSTVNINSFEVHTDLTGCGNDYTGDFNNDGSFSSFASSAVAGGCETIKAKGNNIEVPAGIKKVRVKVTLVDGFTLSTVAFGMAGYGQCHTEIGVRVKGPGMDQYYMDSELLAIAPVAYLSDIDQIETGTYTMEIEFTPRISGGTYRLQAYGKTASLGIAGGMGVGYTRNEGIQSIQASFIR